MQYLLSQEEYDALRNEGQDRVDAMTKNLQSLCTQVATHKPIKVEWMDTVKPWGCILNDETEKNPGYCDECPVQDDCPHHGKRWSQ